jgi:hypothetical protein
VAVRGRRRRRRNTLSGRGRRKRGRSLLALCAAVALVAGATSALVSGPAAGKPQPSPSASLDRPVISGSALVGYTLTSSEVPTSFGLYKWQSCNPSTSDCSDSLAHNDPNWTDLTGESHTGLTYVPTAGDVGNYVRVLVHDNDLGDKWATSVPVGPVAWPYAPPPPAPEHGVSVLAKGNGVKVKKPGQNGYTPLDNLTKLPVDTVFDARGGTVNITAAVGAYGNTTPDQSVDFYGGIFRIKQDPDTDSPAVAKLVEKLSCGKAKGPKASASSGGGPVAVAAGKRKRRVWGSGHGGYGTAGSGGTGSVLGTTWLTQDTCRGTFFKVIEGLGINVFDFDLNETVTLGPGQSYFAKNR